MKTTTQQIFTILFTCLVTTYSLSGVCAELKSPTVRLPAIYHTLKKNGLNKPTITIEELEKCMGQDNKIRQRYEDFQSETKLINDEVLAAEAMVKENADARVLIEKEVEALNAETVEMNNRSELLDKKKLEFSSITSKKVDSATAKRINAQIDQFNREVKQQNASSSVLNERIRQFKEKQIIFNESLLSLKLKLEHLNDKTTQFADRKIKFDAYLADYKGKCDGERELVK